MGRGIPFIRGGCGDVYIKMRKDYKCNSLSIYWATVNLICWRKSDGGWEYSDSVECRVIVLLVLVGGIIGNVEWVIVIHIYIYMLYDVQYN